MVEKLQGLVSGSGEGLPKAQGFVGLLAGIDLLLSRRFIGFRVCAVELSAGALGFQAAAAAAAPSHYAGDASL